MAFGNLIAFLMFGNYDKFSDGSPTFYMINLALLSAGILAMYTFIALKQMRAWFFKGAFALAIAWYAVAFGEIGIPGRALLIAHPFQELVAFAVLYILPGFLLLQLWANRRRFCGTHGIREPHP